MNVGHNKYVGRNHAESREGRIGSRRWENVLLSLGTSSSPPAENKKPYRIPGTRLDGTVGRVHRHCSVVDFFLPLRFVRRRARVIVARRGGVQMRAFRSFCPAICRTCRALFADTGRLSYRQVRRTRILCSAANEKSLTPF